MAGSKVIFVLLVTFAITLPCLEAGIAVFDDFLKKQAEIAHEIALKSYVPNPENIATDLKMHVHRALEEKELKEKYTGPCLATNPIDRCWRCNKDSAKEKLAKCGMGFGRKAVGV